MGHWEECVLCFCWIKYSIDVFYIRLVWNLFVDLFLSGWPIYWWQWNTEVSHYNCVEVGLICSFKYSSVCLVKLGTPTLGAYKFMNVISSWCIVPFISKKWLSLSLLTNSGLKLTNLYLLMGYFEITSSQCQYWELYGNFNIKVHVGLRKFLY
jgi:hypothetical protein